MLLQIDRPYIALNSKTYITIRQQEPRTCKRIGYEFYCKYLFVVKHKSRYNCKSTIYFDLGPDIIKESCRFAFYYNKTDITTQYLMEEMKLLFQIGQMINKLSAMLITTFQLKFQVILMCW